MAKKEVDLRERLASDVLKIVETHEALIGVIDKENVEIKRLKRKRDRLLHDVDRLLYDVVKVEDKYGMTLRRVMDSLDKDVANDVAGDMLALRTRIELLNGTSVEELVKVMLTAMTGDDK